MGLLRLVVWAALVAMACTAASCAQRQPPQMPLTAPQYDAMQQSDPQAFAGQTILMHNLGRVLDEQLDGKARGESLELVLLLGGDDSTVRRQLASAMDLQCPDELRAALLAYLMQKDAGELTQHIIHTLPSLGKDNHLREGVLEWLTRNPTPAALAEVVKLWAAQPVDGPSEEQFRTVVERQTACDWHSALLDGINTPNFFARGSAIEVLAGRVAPQTLRERVSLIQPKTDAMLALQAFMKHFGYLPASGDEFLSVTVLFMSHRDQFEAPAGVAGKWHDGEGYAFNVRDYHLLAYLSADTARDPFMPRGQLLADLETALAARPPAPGRQGTDAPDQKLSDFQQHLTLADLWNLKLLDEMLSRKAVQSALRVMAQRDQADATAAWGGLITCSDGQAGAKLYPAAAGGTDKCYLPAEQAIFDGRDALCRFVGHFDKVQNATRAGSDAIELADAAVGNYYSLVLTSLSETTFCAHYVNPSGVVVSLGVFAMGE